MRFEFLIKLRLDGVRAMISLKKIRNNGNSKIIKIYQKEFNKIQIFQKKKIYLQFYFIALSCLICIFCMLNLNGFSIFLQMRFAVCQMQEEKDTKRKASAPKLSHKTISAFFVSLR